MMDLVHLLPVNTRWTLRRLLVQDSEVWARPERGINKTTMGLDMESIHLTQPEARNLQALLVTKATNTIMTGSSIFMFYLLLFAVPTAWVGIVNIITTFSLQLGACVLRPNSWR